MEALIPELVRSRAAESIAKTYKVGVKDAENAFMIEAAKHRDFLAKLASAASAGPKELEKFEKWKEYRNILKKVKKSVYYGNRTYARGDVDRRSVLKEIIATGDPDLSLHRKILESHASTQERMDDYERFYGEIWAVTGKPGTLLDVSCGMNPFSIPWMGLKDFAYLACDVKEQELGIIWDYLSFAWKRFGVKSEVKTVNFLDDYPESFRRNADVALMLKLLPVMERRRRGTAEKILEWAKADWIVASFSRESLTKREKIENREEKTMTRILSRKYEIIKKIVFGRETVLIARRKAG